MPEPGKIFEFDFFDIFETSTCPTTPATPQYFYQSEPKDLVPDFVLSEI